jgi:hypothetical protein
VAKKSSPKRDGTIFFHLPTANMPLKSKILSTTKTMPSQKTHPEYRSYRSDRKTIALFRTPFVTINAIEELRQPPACRAEVLTKADGQKKRAIFRRTKPILNRI